MRKHLHTQCGFTLLEVLLALAIFSLIGITTVSSISQIVNTKRIALEQLDAYDAIRTGLSILRSDLHQAFHLLSDDLPPIAQQAKREETLRTLFDGRKDQLVFTSVSHRVYFANVRECDQSEISYFLQSMQTGNLFSLMKRESAIIDENPYEGGGIIKILDYVRTIEFKYWDPKEQKWQDEWNSDGRVVTNRFPLAVKILLTTQFPNREALSVESQIKVDFPNNEPVVAKLD